MNPENLFLKRAELKDVNLLFNWINEPTVRGQSISTEVVSYENHEKWFSSKIKEQNCYLYIVYLNSMAVGMIRFDMPSDYATVSYLVDKMHRGKGIGYKIVIKGIDQFLNDSNYKGNIEAIVRHSNPASIKIFEKLKFEKLKQNENFVFFIKSYS